MAHGLAEHVAAAASHLCERVRVGFGRCQVCAIWRARTPDGRDHDGENSAALFRWSLSIVKKAPYCKTIRQLSWRGPTTSPDLPPGWYGWPATRRRARIPKVPRSVPARCHGGVSKLVKISSFRPETAARCSRDGYLRLHSPHRDRRHLRICHLLQRSVRGFLFIEQSRPMRSLTKKTIHSRDTFSGSEPHRPRLFS